MSINFRFEVTLVGEGAKDFAKVAVESEMAQACHPKGYNASQDADPAQRGSFISSQSASKSADNEKELLTLFCPVGEVSKGLARVRFICCESFSDSLPVHKEPTVAANSAIIFLFWRVDKSSSSATSERVSDFMTRLAELNHGAPVNARPLTVIWGFELDSDQETRLNDFLKLPLASGVRLEKFDEDGEDIVVEALTGLCEKIITVLNRRRTTALAVDDRQPAKGKCCTVS